MAENTFLQGTWFLLFGVLLVGYAILDGFDLGVGMQHLYTARTDRERRTLLNAIGPVWDGNEVWLITAGGALFAAFPRVYATVFSGFYLALMLVLAALILRAVSLEFRSKEPGRGWRTTWDAAFSIGSILPAILFGVAIGNVMRGVPLTADAEYAGDFLGLLSPFAIAVGLLSASMFLMQGGAWLQLKTEGVIRDRARRVAVVGWVATLVMWVVVTAWSRVEAPGLWDAYGSILAWVAPAAFVVLAVAFPLLLRVHREGWAFLASSGIVAALVGTLGIALYPVLLPARGSGESLTANNTASSDLTLTVMLIIAVIGMPLVLTYTTWVYRTFRGKVVLDEEHGY
ncbi:MAG: cytochrome d ubiquinol oxidase, subunit [Chloroflexi bacterium]|jgi:cytochrome d ubiquinol oxidase subunit II|nr:cytochrome d ubiquinol oxidase, subunit [Chloroflexota bacterium]